MVCDNCNFPPDLAKSAKVHDSRRTRKLHDLVIDVVARGDALVEEMLERAAANSKRRTSWIIDGDNYTNEEAIDIITKLFVNSCRPDSGSEQRADQCRVTFLKLASQFLDLGDGETTLDNSVVRSLFGALVIKTNPGASKHFMQEEKETAVQLNKFVPPSKPTTFAIQEVDSSCESEIVPVLTKPAETIPVSPKSVEVIPAKSGSKPNQPVYVVPEAPIPVGGDKLEMEVSESNEVIPEKPITFAGSETNSSQEYRDISLQLSKFELPVKRTHMGRDMTLEGSASNLAEAIEAIQKQGRV